MTINNIDDLRAEIALLRVKKKEQEAAIKQHFSSPSAIINTMLTAVKGSGMKNSFFNPDELIGLASRFIIPLALNKTIFRKSNFIIKTLITLVSQQASGFVTQDAITSVWGKIRSFISNRKSKKQQPVDYGIPPFSESY